VSNRSPIIIQDAAKTESSALDIRGLDAGRADLTVTGLPPSTWQQTKADAEVPPWQRDTGFCHTMERTARGERLSTIKSIAQLGRVGVILDDSFCVLEGTSGWVSHVLKLPTLRLQQGKMVPASTLSQNDFSTAVKRLTSDQSINSLSILLRDLDGWGGDLLQLFQVGYLNPNCVLLILPKSSQDFGNVVASLATDLGLSKREVTIATLMLQGRIDQEIATRLKMGTLATKKAITSILRKFRVRRCSDFVRLFARLP
jgi:DNA-binding CsgD family transcriptional regulator